MKTVKDGFITHYWKNLYDINADIVGSPTISNYIVGGLSDSNYLVTPSTFQPLNNFEILIKITTGSSVTSSSNLSFVGTSNDKTCLVMAVESSKFKLYLSSGSSSWNIANGIKGSYTVLPNTVYYVKLLHDENSYTLSYSLDNINFINDIIINNSSNLSQTKLRFGRTYSNGQSFNGSIDFEKSYIKINNDVWWNGLSVVGKTPGTADDYDYTTTENIYKAVKQIERFYWKREETEQSWTQPVLSANGTIGGNSFACAANSEYNPAWRAFDNETSNDWENNNGDMPCWLEWYNPNALKVTQIVIVTGIKASQFFSTIYGCLKNYKIQASSDNSNWADIYTGSNSSYSAKKSLTINISDNNFYKYWRIYVTSVNNENYASIWNVAITATQLQETITPGTAEDYDFYTDETVYKCLGNVPETIFESSTGGSYSVNIPVQGQYEITCIGAGGPAAMRGVYDDKGYGWGGGSGAGFTGIFNLAAGSYTAVVGSANNNTTAQSGNTQTLNPSDTTTHDSYIQGVVTCGGGGAAHYNTSYVGAGGAAPVLTLTPISTTLNTAGNAGSYNSGGKGSASAATCAGGASVYVNYGKGQGCKTSEYASKRSWINGTNGYIRIRRIY